MQRSFNCFYVRVTTRGGYLYLHFLWGTGLSFLYCWMQLMGEAVLVLWLQVFFMFACLPTKILSCITHFILTYCLCFGFFFLLWSLAILKFAALERVRLFSVKTKWVSTLLQCIFSCITRTYIKYCKQDSFH